MSPAKHLTNRLAIVALAWVVAALSVAEAQSPGARKIPIRRSQSAAQDTIEPVSNQQTLAQQYPVPMRPGEITSVEIRNGAGEIISGELDEGEFIVGPRPEPVHIGQPFGESVMSPMPNQEHAIPIESYQGGCDSCDQSQCNGECGSGASPSYDPRVEAIARAIAYPLSDLWVRADYLQLSIDGGHVPALVTTGNSNVARDDAGVIGVPGTRVLFGDGELGGGERSGGRIEIGKFLPGDVGLAFSASILFSDDESQSFTASSATNPILARPFFDVSPTNSGANAELVSFPTELSGNIDVVSSSSFGAADVLGRALLISNSGHQLETFIGYQYLSLDDDLTIRDFKQVIGGGLGLAIGTTLDESDRFSTTNDFHGVTLGGQSRHCIGGWSLLSSLKLGLGVTDSSVIRSGSTRAVVPVVGGGTSVSVQDSGLLVLGTNRGVFNETALSVAPELRLMVQRELWDQWNVSVGYEFLYWSRVLRAGDQIDPLINLTQVGPGGLQGLARPGTTPVYDDVLIHGLAIGLYKEF